MEKLFKNTPIIKIKYKYKNETKYIYAKLEYYTFTGSIKDKVVYYILKKALEQGEYDYGLPLVEASSGNTALSLAALGSYYNSPVYIFMPNWVSKERKKLLELYGANVKTYSKRQGGFIRCIDEAKKLKEEIHGYMIDQFSNYNNILAHQKYTAKEIIKKVKKIDTFVSGIGSGGTITGCSRIFKRLFDTKIVAIISKTKNKIHKIDGISDGFIPDVFDETLIDINEYVLDEDAINMAMKLSEELGLGVGISSGANFIASVINNEGNTVTIFPDDNKKYLSTFKNKKRNKTYFISDDIELISFKVV